jgi:KamA family protein
MHGPYGGVVSALEGRGNTAIPAPSIFSCARGRGTSAAAWRVSAGAIGSAVRKPPVSCERPSVELALRGTIRLVVKTVMDNRLWSKYLRTMKTTSSTPGARSATAPAGARPFRILQRRDLDGIEQLARLPESDRFAMKVVSAVLPFRANTYVIDELIDWSRVPEDPIFQLTFPQRGMLRDADFEEMAAVIRAGASEEVQKQTARAIQLRLNPHPAGQTTLNVPRVDGEPVPGLQHKYRETVLFFPNQGQTCHAYCTYCFRWPQFVGLDELTFASREAEQLVAYLEAHPEVTSVLFTGGDPLVMRTQVLRRYVEPLLRADLPNLASIRLGTKAMAYHPRRFLDDRDADDLMRLFEEVSRSGKSLAFMAHYSHPRELETPAAQAAVRRILGTGAIVRAQAPLIRHVNDDARAWAELWRLEVQLGAIPYYMFMARDTGAQPYFEVPIERGWEIYREALSRVSGLARTVRGPSMSCTPGKVVVDGIAEIHGEKVFALRLLQARNPDWVGRPFFARFDPTATWFDDLRPAFGEEDFFFGAELRQMLADPHGAHGWKASPLSRRRLPLFLSRTRAEA